MNPDELFERRITLRIWNQFFDRVHRVSKPLDKKQRHELILELQDHLLESFREESGENEPDRLLNTIERMGHPEIFLKPMLADRFISRAGQTLSLRAVLQALYYNTYRGFVMTFVSLLLGLGYVATFVIAAMAPLKPLFPNNVGLLFFEDGGFIIGFSLGNDPIAADPLGYWIIPISLATSALLYFMLTKLIRLLRKGNPT